jgi:hypothetical protein
MSKQVTVPYTFNGGGAGSWINASGYTKMTVQVFNATEMPFLAVVGTSVDIVGDVGAEGVPYESSQLSLVSIGVPLGIWYSASYDLVAMHWIRPTIAGASATTYVVITLQE